MPAELHPGRVTLVMNHSVITLREGGLVGGAETAFLSLYDIFHSLTLGAGCVALLRVVAAGVDVVLAERVELGRRMQQRLLSMGHTHGMLSRPPLAARFTRDPWAGDSLGYRIEASGLEVTARWERLSAPFYALGPAPAFSPAEDIWSIFTEAAAASVIANGLEASGAPFTDDAWASTLGRALCSAHVALAETRVTPAVR